MQRIALFVAAILLLCSGVMVYYQGRTLETCWADLEHMTLERDAWRGASALHLAQVDFLKEHIVELDRRIRGLENENARLRTELSGCHKTLDGWVKSARGAYRELDLSKLTLEGELPTVEEVKAFLKEDDTNYYPYDPEYWICRDFARMLQRRLRDRGMTAYFTLILDGADYQGRPAYHALVAVPTTSGIVFVEPQTDEVMPWPHWGDKLVTKIVMFTREP